MKKKEIKTLFFRHLFSPTLNKKCKIFYLDFCLHSIQHKVLSSFRLILSDRYRRLDILQQQNQVF